MITEPWDLTGHISSQLFGKPLPPKPTLPTVPGVYIIDQPHHHGNEHWWVGSVLFELSRTGYWSVDRKPRTADEVDTIRHGQELIALVPTTEADL